MRTITMLICAATLLVSACQNLPSTALTSSTRQFSLPPQAAWSKLDAVSYKGKQDDIHFIEPKTGWYVNGAGNIYKTASGGAS